MGAILIVLLLFLGSLFFRDQRLPRFAIGWIESALASDVCSVSIDAASFGFRRGLSLQGVTVYDLTRADWRERPAGRARSLAVDWFRRRVTAAGVEYKRLPDAYYDPWSSTGRRCFNHVVLPELGEFDVRVDGASILGAEPETVTARVAIGGDALRVTDLRLTLPGPGPGEELAGDLTIDFGTDRLTGSAAGTLLHGQIGPVVEVLDQTNALEYVEAFTEVAEPVRASYAIDVNLYTHDMDLTFDLGIPECRYRGVRMAQVNGSLGVHTYHVGKDCRFLFELGLREAVDPEGRVLKGGLTTDDLDGPVRIGLTEVSSTLRIDDLLKVIDVFTLEDLKPIDFDSAPQLMVSGRCGASPEDVEGFDVTGTMTLPRCRIGRLPIRGLRHEWTYRAGVLSSYLTGAGEKGGRYDCHVTYTDPEGNPETAEVTLRANYRDGSLDEIGELLSFEPGEHFGKVEAYVDLKGAANTNILSTLCGKGSVKITGEYLGRIKLFAELKDSMAKLFPGVPIFQNKSEASGSFTVENGLFRSDDICIEGGLFLYKAAGTYDAVANALDLDVNAYFIREETKVGRLIHEWITDPLTHLVVEYRLTGSPLEPRLECITLVEKIYDGVLNFIKKIF